MTHILNDFMVFFSYNATTFVRISFQHKKVLGKKLLTKYDCTFLKSFAAHFYLLMSFQVKRLTCTKLTLSWWNQEPIGGY